MFTYGETVTILTAGTETDPYSNKPAASWEVLPSELEVEGCGVEPRPSAEPTQEARNSVTSGFTLYLPTGTEITPQNRVVVRGGTYEVLGEAAEWVNPFTGWAPGVVVQVQRVDG
ncbi:hypothetical protein [Arthrobacter sp. Alg241-R88]|uniref:hypothetical protein n=1 Tax=Arthrobacter sp. Alg241-R88 TaxID=2305984 RepID=UPI0013D1BE46|nr:hypothetical protein [Arthrobacter sp. Alg241-R88]